MFKSLIATCLLTFSCSGIKPQQVPQEENNEMTLNVPMLANSNLGNVLQGGYVMRQECDWDYVVSNYSTFVYDFDLTDNNIFCYLYNGTYNHYELIDNYLEFTCLSQTRNVSFNVSYEYGQSAVSWNRGYLYQDLDNCDTQTKYAYLYFVQPYYIAEDNVFSLFNYVFVQSGNDYFVNYTGWYTFSEQPNFSSTFYVFGSLMGNNNLYQRMFVSSTGYISFSNPSDYEDVVVYNNGGFQKVNNRDVIRQVYFTGVLIPSTTYSSLSNMGVFNYVPNSTQYTFGEMIFNIMDAPIYFLTNLFSFELFGVEFYVAFFSIVSVVLICFVLRKII